MYTEYKCKIYGHDTDTRTVNYGSYSIVETYCRRCGHVINQRTIQHYEPRAPYYDDDEETRVQKDY
jgi:hypothetical protein